MPGACRPGSRAACRCAADGPRHRRRRAACRTWTAAWPAPCRTPDSGRPRSEADGSAAQDAGLPWRCRSDWRRRVRGRRATRPQSSPPGDGVKAAPSRARRRRRPAAEGARRGPGRVALPPERSLRPRFDRFAERPPEMPIGLATARGRHPRRRCCPGHAVPAGAAARSGSRSRPAASCPGSGRADRRSPGRCQAGPPSPP